MALNRPVKGVADWDVPLNANWDALNATTTFLSVTTGTDIYATVTAAIAALPSTGGDIVIPAGNYNLSAMIAMSKANVTLRGAGKGSVYAGNTGATTLTVAAGVTGIDITGTRCRVADLFLYSSSSGAGADDGIRVRGPAPILERISVKNFGNHGVLTNSTAANCNHWHYSDIECYGNRGDGFRWEGGVDMSVGQAINLNADSNTGWGFNLGGTTGGGMTNCLFTVPHAAGNVGGAYKVNSSSNYLFDVYTESGTGSTFTIGAGISATRVWFNNTAQPTTITNSGGASNEIYYKVPEGWLARTDFFIGPTPGATTPTTYRLASGHIANGGFSLRDDTNLINILRYDPGGNPLHSLGASGFRISNQGSSSAPLLLGPSSGMATAGDIRSLKLAQWKARNNAGSADINYIVADTSDIVQVGDESGIQLKTANAAQWVRGSASESLTIAAAATTDTAANLLPANSIIEAVVVRVTTVIPTAATFTVGDATQAARFATGVSTAATTTAVGLLHANPTVASADLGPVQTAAAKIRITPNLTPGTATGVLRITVFFRSFVAPTS